MRKHLKSIPLLILLLIVPLAFIMANTRLFAQSEQTVPSGIYSCHEVENGLLASTGYFELLPNGFIRDLVTQESGTWLYDSKSQVLTINGNLEVIQATYDAETTKLEFQLRPDTFRTHTKDDQLHCYYLSSATIESKANSTSLSDGEVVEQNLIDNPPTGRLAFESDQDGNGEIYLMDEDGSNLFRLTNNPARDTDPTWSPDAKRIAFQSDRGGDENIYIIDTDGTNLFQLTNDPANDFSPTWSPNGEYIVFGSIRDGNHELYLIKPDGTGLVRLTNNNFTDAVASWSPNSTKLVFQTDRDGDSEIFTMNIDGSQLQQLTSNTLIDWGPAWSPDGTKIAFVCNRNGSNEICVMDEDGANLIQLTNNPANDWIPQWSPDGDQIAFVSDRDGNFEIYKMNSDGSGETRLTFDSASDIVPEWTVQNTILQKVLHLIWDPYLPQRQVYLTSYYIPPEASAQQTIASFKDYTRQRVKFVIQEQIKINDFPLRSDGFRHDESSFFFCVNNNWPQTPTCASQIVADYDDFINDPLYDICGRLNRGEIDEVWLDPPPYAGFYESALAGPSGFWYNGPTYSSNNCNELIPLMTFNYSRSWDGGHAFGHRQEATMTAVYGSWVANDPDPHNWENFGKVRFLSSDFPYAGCGSIHFPPNSTSFADEYNYDNTVIPFDSICDDFFNYPDLGNPPDVSQPVSCIDWGCSGVGYYEWWFSHLPHFDDFGYDGKLNDWWLYFLDPNLVLSVPSAEFYGTPLSGTVPHTVFFTNLSSSNYDSVMWDFGDGNTSSQKDPIHQYNKPGVFTVQLTVIGIGGLDIETKYGYVIVDESAFVFLPMLQK